MTKQVFDKFDAADYLDSEVAIAEFLSAALEDGAYVIGERLLRTGPWFDEARHRRRRGTPSLRLVCRGSAVLLRGAPSAGGRNQPPWKP